ncbi:hypothetical protein [Micromonospora luteifusca]|uniref:hypothetical protein n=1 Tax=Micromonospora luteifusca TaxID=709860 RepID=UPI00339F3651
MRRVVIFAMPIALLVATLIGGSAAHAASTLPVAAVAASGHDGNVPGNALDGSLSTRWSAEGDGS